ncbi:kinase domain-containing protein [Salix suchowensis]|nr:kinase domain-containing protein [Salix suchowensis]
MGAVCCRPQVRIIRPSSFHITVTPLRTNSPLTSTVKLIYSTSSCCAASERELSGRDLKPDNILLDERGNAHLTDFNIAVHFSDRKLNSVAGSMAYMEILAKRGYTYYIDWWSLGVCATNSSLDDGRSGGVRTATLPTAYQGPLKYPEDAEKKCSRAGLQVIRGAKKANFDASHELEELLLEDNPSRLKHGKRIRTT